MPDKLARACRVCGEPSCQQHANKGRMSAYNQARGSAASKGYDRRWDSARLRHLSAYPFCGQRPGNLPPVMSKCFDEGILTAGFQVDHVQPHRGNKQLFWDQKNNWQTLCRSCGARKTAAGL